MSEGWQTQGRRWFFAGLLIATFGGCARPADSVATPNIAATTALRELTQAHTRVVWVRDPENGGDYCLETSPRTVLMGLDTEDDCGERELLNRSGYITKPLLAPRGDRVVFTEAFRTLPRIRSWSIGRAVMRSRTRRIEARIVNWDGSGVRTIAAGYAVEVWGDPRTGREWVYVQAGPFRAGDDFKRNAIYRYDLNRPEAGELVWDDTPVDATSGGSFQLSEDGKFAVGMFPWPDAGVADLETKQWVRIGTGCWAGMAPDNSYRPWIFDGAHRNLLLVGPDGATTAKINLPRAGSMHAAEVYHPRWSNDPRMFAFTGPYGSLQRQELRVSGKAEVLVARFNDGFSGVQGCVQVTTNSKDDYFPDVWVDDSAARAHFGATGRPWTTTQPETARWPGDVGGLVFRWEDGAKKNEVFDGVTQRSRLCRVQLRGLARYGRFHAMDLTGGGGAFVAESGNAELLAGCRESNELTVEATLTAADATTEPATIIAFGGANQGANFSLRQDGGSFVFLLRTTQEGRTADRRIVFGTVEPGVARHVMVSYDPARFLRAYIDGELKAEAPAAAGSFAEWKQATLHFGAIEPGARGWSGQLEGCAAYDVAIDPQHAAAHAALNAARRADREPAPHLVVRARLEEMTPIPAPASIAPYRRCLVVHRYRIEEVVSGTADDGPLFVAHWGVLDGKKLNTHQPRVGANYELVLERFDDNPQLESERMDMGNADLAAPLYYDPLPWHAGFPAEASEVKPRKSRAVVSDARNSQTP